MSDIGTIFSTTDLILMVLAVCAPGLMIIHTFDGPLTGAHCCQRYADINRSKNRDLSDRCLIVVLGMLGGEQTYTAVGTRIGHANEVRLNITRWPTLANFLRHWRRES